MGLFSSVSVLSKVEGSNGKVLTLSCTGSTGYTTGGETLNVAAHFAVVDNIVGSSFDGRYDARFNRSATAGDPSNCRVPLFDADATDGGDQVTSGANLSTVNFILTVFGR